MFNQSQNERRIKKFLIHTQLHIDKRISYFYSMMMSFYLSRFSTCWYVMHSTNDVISWCNTY